MQPASEHHIPDGLLASITLLSEKPRHGVTSRKSALQSGIDQANSTAAIGLQFRCWEIASGTVDAPSNGTVISLEQYNRAICAQYALKKNGVALALDVAGVGAGFLPGGELVVAGAQGAISVASGVNSAVGGDAAGAALGVLGLPAGYAGTAAKLFGVGAKAIPGVGTAIAAFAGLNDAYGTYQDYQACQAGH